MNGVGPSIDDGEIDPSRYYTWGRFCRKAQLPKELRSVLLRVLRRKAPEGFFDITAKYRGLYGRVGIEHLAMVGPELERRLNQNRVKKQKQRESDEEE